MALLVVLSVFFFFLGGGGGGYYYEALGNSVTGMPSFLMKPLRPDRD